MLENKSCRREETASGSLEKGAEALGGVMPFAVFEVIKYLKLGVY